MREKEIETESKRERRQQSNEKIEEAIREEKTR